MIVAVKTNNALRYRAALISEILTRVARHEAASQTTVENFYTVHPELRGHEGTVASLAPWVQRTHSEMPTDQLLDEIARQARVVVSGTRDSYAGDWYGLIVEEITYANGSKTPFWMYAKLRVAQSGQGLLGVGELFDGEQVALSAIVGKDGKVAGQVVNTTYNLQFEIVGQVSASSMVADFSGESGGRGRSDARFSFVEVAHDPRAERNRTGVADWAGRRHADADASQCDPGCGVAGALVTRSRHVAQETVTGGSRCRCDAKHGRGRAA